MKHLFYFLLVSFLLSCEGSNSGYSSEVNYSPSFTGNVNSSTSGTYIERIVQGYYANGARAGQYEIISRGGYSYARLKGGTLEYIITTDSNYGYNFTFWNGASWIYFF